MLLLICFWCRWAEEDDETEFAGCRLEDSDDITACDDILLAFWNLHMENPRFMVDALMKHLKNDSWRHRTAACHAMWLGAQDYDVLQAGGPALLNVCSLSQLACPCVCVRTSNRFILHVSRHTNAGHG